MQDHAQNESHSSTAAQILSRTSITSHSACCVLMDISSPGFATDTEAAEWFVREIGVAGVPGSSFFREPEHRFIRFHFAKKEETLDAAGVKLERLRKGR